MNMMRLSIPVALLAIGGLLSGCGGNAPTKAEPVAAPKPVVAPAAPVCAAGIWFCENFESGSLARWALLPGGGGATIGTADGKAAIEKEGANSVLHYDAGSSKGVVATVTDAAFAPVADKKTADYFVEARIKPINNKTSNKFVCLLGRYQDANNWYGGCLNVQNGASSKVEFHKANNGKWFRAKQFTPLTIVNDAWYKLRMEMKGDALTFYLNDDFIGTIKDTSIAKPGKVGLWLDNRSFMVDDIIVGDANVKPVLLALDSASAWNSEVGGDDLAVNVTASKADGKPDDFSVSSSDAKVVSVAKSGNKTVLHAVGAGSAKITWVSGSNPAMSKTVAANIEPAFVQATATYGKLKGKTSPAAGSRDAYVDGTLRLAFDAPVALTGKGSVRIFAPGNARPVDVIKPTGERDAIGPSAEKFYRGVAMPLMSAEGNTLVVRPHSGKLQYGAKYYVTVADGTLKDAKLGGKAFTGLGEKAGWKFATRKAPKAGLTALKVDGVGTKADFRSVQGALNYAMQKLPADKPVTIKVANGTYNELLYLRGKNNVTILGENRDKTVIQFDNFESLNGGSGSGVAKAGVSSGGGRAVFLAEQSDMLKLERLTLKNPHLKVNGINNQAETIYFNGTTQRLVARNANFISRQDTLQLNGYSWFYDTLIAGDVDFIWGSAKASLFENSEIRTVVDSTDATKGGYLVQARVTDPKDKGYVFLNSRITREAAVPDSATDLARSAGVPSYYDNVVYINCKMDKHVEPAGWWINPIPNPDKASATAGWREFGSTALDGSALNLTGRVVNAHALTAAEAAPYLTREQVFSAIKWNPAP